MTSAREFFEAASEAERGRRAAEDALEYGPAACGGRRGPGDPSSGGPTFARAASDERARAAADAFGRAVSEARARCSELRAVLGRRADAVELHYVDLLTWDEVAARLLVGRRTAISWRDQAFDWVDSMGWARLRSGTGCADDVRRCGGS